MTDREHVGDAAERHRFTVELRLVGLICIVLAVVTLVRACQLIDQAGQQLRTGAARTQGQLITVQPELRHMGNVVVLPPLPRPRSSRGVQRTSP